MIKFLFLLITCFSITTDSIQLFETEKDFEIVGKWKAEDETGFVYFTFDNDGYVIMETNETTIGGKKFQQADREFSLKYSVDYTTAPINLDLIFTELKSGRQMNWLFIMKVNSQNEMVLARGMNGERPKDFVGLDYQIFKRVENQSSNKR
ncbi:MAG: hypothetical protein ABGX00_04360 [Allomuricauda sp.]